MPTTELKITGMMCDACVQHVGKALRAVPDVRQAEVDLQAGRATVRHEGADEPALVQALIAAVDEAGYEGEVVR
jgi:copper chaperone CopZ